MNKIFKWFNFFICVFSFNCITVNKIPNRAYSDMCEIKESKSDDTKATTFVSNYFKKLSNFTNNTMGSCGYQAINMLLNFYDTFWNDDIIDEKYELKSSDESLSPGSKFDKIYSSDVKSSRDYYKKLSDDTIFKQLLTIGISKGYTKLSDTSKNDFAITNDQISDILKTYVNDFTSVSDDFYYYSNYSESSSYLRNKIIEYVSNGIPVIVTAHSSSYYHAFVAYEYNKTTDQIFFHSGYTSINYHHNNLDENFSNIDGVFAISPIKLNSHKHSDNYIINNVNYCSCKLSNHEHAFYRYKYNKNNHKAYCYCSSVLYEAHMLDCDNNCVYCNTYIDLDNNFGTLISLGGTQ